MSAHTKIGLENEDTLKLRNEVTSFSTGITVWVMSTKIVCLWTISLKPQAHCLLLTKQSRVSIDVSLDLEPLHAKSTSSWIWFNMDSSEQCFCALFLNTQTCLIFYPFHLIILQVSANYSQFETGVHWGIPWPNPMPVQNFVIGYNCWCWYFEYHTSILLMSTRVLISEKQLTCYKSRHQF